MIALDFSGQTAVVTGGLQGIGKAIAQLLHRGGANVVIGDIAARAREQSLRQLVLRTDVASRERPISSLAPPWRLSAAWTSWSTVAASRR